MVPSGLLLATLLVAQAPSAAAPANPAGPRTVPLVSVQESLAKDAPEKLMIEAVEPTDHEALTGEPQALVTVLARMGGDRGRQQRAVSAYWQLVAAVADYHFRQHEVDYLRQLEGFESSATAHSEEHHEAGDPLRIAAADARRGQAQLNAIEAQHALASWLGVPPTTPLPLPVDRPHVNAYRTYYQQLFPNGGSLALRRIDTTLPIRRQEIAIRARCVRRAEQALAIAETAYVSGRGGRRQLLAFLNRLSDEREMFVEAVRKYNVDIGEYAITVARPGAPATDLVAMMLIHASLPAQSSPTPGFIPSRSAPGFVPRPGTVLPGGYNQPATYNGPVVPAGGRSPDSAAPRFGEPTLASPQPAAKTAQAEVEPASDGPSEVPEGWRSTDHDAPSAGDSESAPGAIQIPDEASPIPTSVPQGEDDHSRADADMASTERQAQRVTYLPDDRASNLNIPRTLALDTSRYHELADLTPKIRAQRLAEWIEEEPGEVGGESATSAVGLRRVTLAECLDRNLASRRSDPVASYWNLWHAARAVAIRTWHVEQLEGLVASVNSAADRTEAGDLQLQTALDSAEASRLGLVAELETARLRLVSQLATWPPNVLPAVGTAPHAGGYDMKASTQSARVTNTREFQHLLDTIPRRHLVVVDRATAVLDAAAERTHALAQHSAGSTTIDTLLNLVEQQVGAELSFTKSVAEYNTAIARYVDLVLPATVPTEVFLKASVLRR